MAIQRTRLTQLSGSVFVRGRTPVRPCTPRVRLHVRSGLSP